MPRLARLRRIAVMGALLLSLLVFVWYLTDPTRGEHDHIKSNHYNKKTTLLSQENDFVKFYQDSLAKNGDIIGEKIVKRGEEKGEEIERRMDKGEERESEKEGQEKEEEKDGTVNKEGERQSEREGEEKDNRITVNTEQSERKEKVKEMIKHAWYGYYNYTMGHNELKPISKSPNGRSVFRRSPIGATLVDSLDTLYIAGLTTEFEIAKRWVKEHFDLKKANTLIPLFEVNIRFIGGFLSAYLLSGDTIFKDKAIEVAQKMDQAFKTKHGLPLGMINVNTGHSKNLEWVRGCCMLSEIGTLQLEYSYISLLSEDPSFLNKVLNVRRILREHKTSEGVYYTLINPSSLQWCNKHISLGALSDSFYEYLLKAWLLSDKMDTEAKDMFYEAIDVIENKLYLHMGPEKYLFIKDIQNNGKKEEISMQHLACFSGGLYALASVHATNEKSQHYMDIAKNITRTCHESYIKTVTKLGADSFTIDEFGNVKSVNGAYMLRPETVESYFYLWRLTHDPMYREWGWELVQALETQCRISSGGYSGLKNVNIPRSHDDVQQSFFIAETLKYLYLLFSDDTILPLDQWVFNTEGHPLRVVHT